MSSAPTRIVHNTEAVAWLRAQPVLEGCSFITSLPDVSETSLKLPDWKRWFVEAAGLVIDRCPDDGVAIFYQTDIKHEGTWIDKGYLVAKAAEQHGAELLWHKVVCRREPGGITFGRPAYAHMLCFSRGVRADPARSTADVLPSTGEMTWPRAMGVAACRAASRFILDATQTRTIVDPFCGIGTALAVANELGMNSIGVEMSRKRAERAMTLRVKPETA
jgi:hypothetical protein